MSLGRCDSLFWWFTRDKFAGQSSHLCGFLPDRKQFAPTAGVSLLMKDDAIFNKNCKALRRNLLRGLARIQADFYWVEPWSWSHTLLAFRFYWCSWWSAIVVTLCRPDLSVSFLGLILHWDDSRETRTGALVTFRVLWCTKRVQTVMKFSRFILALHRAKVSFGTRSNDRG